MSKPKKFVWHKRRGKMIPSKYAKVHHGAPTPESLKRRDDTADDSPTKRFLRRVAEAAKRAAREK